MTAMFLHSGASLHGHEFSNRPQAAANNHQPVQASTLFRSALGAQQQTPRASSPADNRRSSRSNRRHTLQNPTSTSPRPPIARPLSEHTPPRKEQIVRFDDEPTILSVDGVKDVSAEIDSGSVSEELSDVISSDGESQGPQRLPVSVVNNNNNNNHHNHKRARKPKPPRQATQFLLAFPPPGHRTKQRRFVRIRPRLLLQLQHLSSGRRPTPALDVLPSSVMLHGLPGSTHILPRLVKHCPELFRVKKHLGLDDLVLARSEDYDTPDGEGDDRDGRNFDKRDLVAVVSPLAPQRKNSDKRDSWGPGQQHEAEIVLADGSVWTASPLANGYEFRHTDADGKNKTARWVKRAQHNKPRTSAGSSRNSSPTGRGAPSSPAPGLAPAGGSDYKFTFSMIDPSSRRHPVLATLTPSNLEVLDYYNGVANSSTKTSRRSFTEPPPSAYAPSDLAGPGSDSPARYPVDEGTRTLIAVTSVWVSLRHGHGWPASSPAVSANGSPSASAGSGVAANHNNSSSSNDDCTGEPRRASTFPLSAMSRPSSPTGPPSPAIGAPASATSSPGPKRASSTGAAFMQRRQREARRSMGQDWMVAGGTVEPLPESDEAEAEVETAAAAEAEAETEVRADFDSAKDLGLKPPADLAAQGRRRSICMKIKSWGQRMTSQSQSQAERGTKHR